MAETYMPQISFNREIAIDELISGIDQYFILNDIDFEIDNIKNGPLVVEDFWAIGSVINNNHYNIYLGIDGLVTDSTTVTAGQLKFFAITLDDGPLDDQDDYEPDLIKVSGLDISISNFFPSTDLSSSSINKTSFNEAIFGSNNTISASSLNDVIEGNAGNDSIYGEEGDDALYGGDGNDSLFGGAGDDKLYGGEGSDTFVFTPNSGNDTIFDYSAEEDLIQFLNSQGEVLEEGDITKTLSSNGNYTLSTSIGSNVEVISNIQELSNTFTSFKNHVLSIFEPTTISGHVVKGPLKGANVFLDLNNNGILDTGEPFTTTGEDGSYSFKTKSSYSGADLVAITNAATIDMSNGAATGAGITFKAPSSSTIISPLTTLVKDLINQGKTLSESEAKVKEALGLNNNIDLLNFNPFSNESNPNDSLDVEKASLKVSTIVKTVSTAAKSLGVDSLPVNDISFETLSNLVNNGSLLDLSDTATLTEVVESAKSALISEGATIDPALFSTLESAIIGNLQTTISTIDSATSIPEAINNSIEVGTTTLENLAQELSASSAILTIV